LILLAFLLPLAMYLLILGTINRRRHPLMVYGPWDFIGVLFAASGFLLFGGPGALSALHERWRESLVYGQNPANSASATENLWQLGLLMMAAYFAVVVVGAGIFLWRSRTQTSIYNVELEMVQTVLASICVRLGLQPLRSGNMYYFGRTTSTRTDDLSTKAIDSEQGIQTAPTTKLQTPRPMMTTNVILELDAFRPMCHVTLRWEPAHSGLRQEIENELARELSEMPAPNHALSAWLTLASTGLFLLTFLIGFVVLIMRLINRV
jgi:hypothetical protein